MLGTIFLVALYILVGRIVYHRRWPHGIFPRHVDAERDRWRRQKRTRIAEHADHIGD